MCPQNRMIMIGPDPRGLGGISKVVSLWKEGQLFAAHGIEYITTVSDTTGSKLKDFGKGLLTFISRCDKNIGTVYVHTASNNSFYRKSVFLFAAFMMGKRTFLHIHPSYFVQFLSSLKGFRKKALFILLRQVDTFIVLTEEMRKQISDLFPGKTVEVLRNPVNVRAMKNRNGTERERNRILYLGWYNREKGVYDLVDALKLAISDGIQINMHFYGTKEINELRDYVKKAGIEASVKVNGWAEEERKIEELFKATFLVLPSYTEGIPNVILEAMAARTPIIATLAGGLKEVLREGDNAIIIEPGNVKDISKKIVMGLQNEALRKMIAENAHRDAVEKYDISHIKKRFESMMKQN